MQAYLLTLEYVYILRLYMEEETLCTYLLLTSYSIYAFSNIHFIRVVAIANGILRAIGAYCIEYCTHI